MRVQVPPLRGRPEDVELLAKHFAREAGIDDLPRALLEQLKTRSWRGNARELRNALQAWAAVGQLPAPSASAEPAAGTFEPIVDPTQPYAEQKDAMIDEFTRAYLKALMAYANGNQAAAARIAQLDRTYLGRLLQKYGLSPRR